MNAYKKKIFKDHNSLINEIAIERNNGKKIVLTNGTFDLLHVGHTRSLIDAKTYGDILVVAVNSDDSVKKYKSPNLPIIAQGERMEVLSAIQCVDYVTVFYETTADEIIFKIKPDFYAKGTDYTEINVPEKKTVLSYGGTIVITGDPKCHSTTSIIQKIKCNPV
jgi:D-glycero-beta-D-manno-heptose 1-phosphate adenylyltransferase